MASGSLNEPAWIINQKNKIEDALLKAEALLQVALNAELQNEPPYIVHDYLWALSDIVSSARKLM